MAENSIINQKSSEQLMSGPRERLYTITVFSENSPGILHRVIVTFTRRKLNISSLTVSDTERPNVSRYTIVLRAAEHTVSTIVKQIRRIIEVRECFYSHDEDLIFKELAFIRVVSTPERLGTVEMIAYRQGARVLFASDHSIVVEVTGTEADVRSLYTLLEPHGICEFARSGRIAMRRSPGPRFDGSEVRPR